MSAIELGRNELVATTGAPKTSSDRKSAFLADFVRSFVWALRVERDCGRHAAAGRQLSATAIRDLAAASDAQLAPSER